MDRQEKSSKSLKKRRSQGIFKGVGLTDTKFVRCPYKYLAMTKSVWKENHFISEETTWVRGSVAASKKTVSFVAKTTGEPSPPAWSPLKGNQKHTEFTAATSTTSMRLWPLLKGNEVERL